MPRIESKPCTVRTPGYVSRHTLKYTDATCSATDADIAYFAAAGITITDVVFY